MARNRKAQKTKDTPDAPLIDMAEEDQWRIIKDSGILQKADLEEPLLSPFWEEFFASTALIIPHCFLLLLMEILAHYQYGRKPTFEALADRMIPGVPIISIAIWYSNRYKHAQWMQALLFVLGVASGSRMIWLLNHANWRNIMKFSPPLATAWVYAVMQLNLSYCVLSLLATYGFIWYKNLTLFPTV
ncbi:hypothetical protein BC835DRAFT_1333435 [Cytidiella melzeri]|nr:hypothetical protein BC835DRAFT_1333435 [Cytidiella melzeri]